MIENNIKSIANIFAIKIRSIIRFETVYKWHQLLIHVDNEIIERFVQTAEKMKIINIDSHIDSKAIFKINKCEICALTKAQKIISRSSAKFKMSEKSFFQIIYNLIDLDVVMNKDQWIFHIIYSEYDFHMIFTHRNKSQATNILIKVINIIKIRYGDKVMFSRSNEKQSLEKKFANFITGENIIFEFSVSDTSVQNNHIEWKRSILLPKGRPMRIQVDLSIYLWSWIVQIVKYLMNRILMKKHEWKTFFEAVTERKFNLTHLIQFETKVYFINKHISRKKKIRFKAHINFLIEYDNINIFNIWISSLHKVIRTRDVIFDKNNFYKLSQIDLI